MKFSKLKRLSFYNSKDLPQKIKFRINNKWYYKMWTGIGWVEINPVNDAVEIVDD